MSAECRAQPVVTSRDLAHRPGPLAGSLQPAQRSTAVVGSVTAQNGELSVQLAPIQDRTRTAVVRPVGLPHTDPPAISHWYLDRQGITALLWFATVTAFLVVLGWSL